MVTAPQRREGVEMFKSRDVSERRSCELVGISRSSHRYIEHPRDDSELAERLKQISNKHKRYGYRRAWALLRREGVNVNLKRVHRVWKKEGLTLPRRRPRKRRKGTGEVPCKPLFPNHVWTYDFIHDATENGRKLKVLTVLDEFTRECFRIEPDRSIRADKVVEILDRLFKQFGSPEYMQFSSCGNSSNNTEHIPVAPVFIVTVIANYPGQDGKSVYSLIAPNFDDTSLSPCSSNNWGCMNGVLSGGTVAFNFGWVTVGDYVLYVAIDLNNNWDIYPDGADLVAGPMSVILTGETDYIFVTVNQSDFMPANATITINHTGADTKKVYVYIGPDGDQCAARPLAINDGTFSTITINIPFWGIPDGVYDVCAHIDMDGSGLGYNTGDEFAQGIDLTVPPGTVTINEGDFTTLP